MEFIQASDINLRSAKKISKDTFESNVYRADKKVYKIYKKRVFWRHKNDLERKIVRVKILEHCNISHLVKADACIFNRAKTLHGIRMDYIENEGTMNDFFDLYNNLRCYFTVCLNASDILKEIHNSPINIVVNDFSFCNIVFNEFLETFYIDSDSYDVENCISETASNILLNFYKKRGLPFIASQQTDKYLLLYYFLSSLFQKDIDKISDYTYDSLAEDIKTLTTLREYFQLIKKSKFMPDLPYVGDLIDRKELVFELEYVKKSKISSHQKI